MSKAAIFTMAAPAVGNKHLIIICKEHCRIAIAAFGVTLNYIKFAPGFAVVKAFSYS